MMYDASKFDALGLDRPSAEWTLDSIAVTTAALTQYEDGAITIPGMAFAHPAILFRGITGYGMHDTTMLPEGPRLDDPSITSLLNHWMLLENSGTATMYGAPDVNYNDIPLVISPMARLTRAVDAAETPFRAAPLPGGTYHLDTAGFAVSAGTPYPELAFELAVYLSDQPDVQFPLGNDVPARPNLLSHPDLQDFYTNNPALRDVIISAATNGYGLSDVRFMHYITLAINTMHETGMDTLSALQLAQQTALDHLAIAETYVSEPLVVERPATQPALGQDEISLHFALEGFMAFPPSGMGWEDVVADFVANDPQVREITFGPFVHEADCFYSPFVYSSTSLTQQVINLDPLLDTDTTFNADDYLVGAIDSLTNEGHTWGLPMTLNPTILWYKHEAFTDMGLPEPSPGWTMQDMQFTLEQLDSVYAGDVMPLAPEAIDITYVLLLMAANGGIVYDTRTTPPTINLTDPNAIAAIQQIKLLFDDGLIAYPGFGELLTVGAYIESPPATISTDVLSPYSARFTTAMSPDSPLRMTTFPTGDSYTPVSVNTSAAYISADTPHVEACYRWIQEIADHPELFYGMPARRSVLQSDRLDAIFGRQTGDTYRQLSAMFDLPNVINIPGFAIQTHRGSFIERVLLAWMFDDYILNNADLNTITAETEQNIATYRECIANVPGFTSDMSREQINAINHQEADCATAINPELARFFTYIE